MSGQRSSRWVLAVTVILAVGGALGVVAVYGGQQRAPGEPYVPPADQSTVTVVRRDITVVVAVEAVTSPLPAFTLVAPAAGRIHRLAALDTDDSVEAGAEILRVGSSVVSSPARARFVRWLVPDGGTADAGVPLVELLYVGHGLVGSLPAADAYRLLSGSLSARGSIVGGPAGFDCPVLSAPSVEPGIEPLLRSSPRVVCAIPGDVRAFADLPGQIALSSGQVEDVPALPVTAVSGRADTGEVSVVLRDGTISIQRVGLGATDGAFVEITSGLEVGAVVLTTPPPAVR